jgi:outer membrane protein OmpA-like peptidoglycan-associated protein
MLGAGVDVPLTSALYGSFRLGYADRSHTLLTTEQVPVIVGSSMQQVQIEHTLHASIAEVLAEAGVGVRIGPLRAGVLAGYGLRSFGEVRSEERVVNDQGIVFLDSRSDIRNRFVGSVPSPQSSTMMMTGVLGVDIRLDKRAQWHVTPEVAMTWQTTDLSSTYAWHLTIPSVALRLSYTFLSTHEGPSASTMTVDTASQQNIVAAELPDDRAEPHVGVALEAVGVSAVRIEEAEQVTYFPTLPYIFFDENSDEIPTRYAHNGGGVRAGKNSTAIDLHHQLLAVVAERCAKDASARIVLTGTLSDNERDTSIAARRAAHVADALVQQYGVARARIDVRWRRLPELPSTATGADAALADEENRRVEITSTSADLLMPYRIADTTVTMTPARIELRARTTDSLPVEDWSIAVDGATIRRSSRPLAGGVFFTPTADMLTNALASGVVRCTVEGSHHGYHVDDTLAVAVQAVRLFEKRREHRNDSIIERFELVVFPYNRSDVSAGHRRIIDMVNTIVGPDANIVIEGCTDVIGQEAENRRLSLDRAQSVARYVRGTVTVIGRGEPTDALSQTLPEERMLQRVVKITAAVPVR